MSSELSPTDIQSTIESVDELEKMIERELDGNDGQGLISFIVPAMNEEATIDELYGGIKKHVPDQYRFEVIFIDDGSTDSTWQIISHLAEEMGNVRGIRFRSNFGKANGLTAGYEAAEGEIIFTMDADLQDDPQEIPRFLVKLNEGYDLVSGWKAKRHDPWHKVLPSRVFNKMLSYYSGVNLHDHNCGFKCYRRDLVKQLMLFGEMHRMVPTLAGTQGFKVTEIVVEHHPRQFGVSKYGFERYIRGFSDMLTTAFLRKYGERPSHFFNAFAIWYLVAAAGLVVGAAATTTPYLLLWAAAAASMGLSCFFTGILGESQLRGVMESRTAERTVEVTPVGQSKQALGTGGPSESMATPKRRTVHAQPVGSAN